MILLPTKKIKGLYFSSVYFSPKYIISCFENKILFAVTKFTKFKIGSLARGSGTHL